MSAYMLPTRVASGIQRVSSRVKPLRPLKARCAATPQGTQQSVSRRHALQWASAAALAQAATAGTVFAYDEETGGLALEITEEEKVILEYNQRIAVYNRAPSDFPSFIRNGYQVRVLTKAGYAEQSDGLIYKDFKEGTGAPPEDGQQVVFNYTAYNESGATIDTTYRKGVPAETRLGIGGMIPGFEAGIKGMRVGGNRRIVVPPELGPPVGPSTFFSSRQFEVFDVELISISNCERKKSFGMISKVICDAPIE